MLAGGRDGLIQEHETDLARKLCGKGLVKFGNRVDGTGGIERGGGLGRLAWLAPRSQSLRPSARRAGVVPVGFIVRVGEGVSFAQTGVPEELYDIVYANVESGLCAGCD